MDYLKSFGITTGEGNHQEEAFYGLILVYNVLFKGKDCSRAVEDLLARDAREEWKQY
jgi:hypothetical protein